MAPAPDLMPRVKLEAMPDDLLYHIISHLQAQDIVRLRQVCANFERITGERTVWLNAYRDATVLRPPGPYLHQSNRDLEECLVKANRLHENWTSPCPQPVTERNLLPATGMSFLNSAKLVLGRFLILGKPGLLTCYDLDFGDWTLPIATYKALLFDTLDSRVVTDANGGKSALIALFPKATISPITVLKMLLPPSRVTFQLEHITQTEWRPSARFTRTRIADDYLLMTTSFETRIFHPPTRRYYSVPEPDSWQTDVNQYHEYHITPTHLINFCLAPHAKTLLVQAFLLPHVHDRLKPSSEPIPALTRTHVGGHFDFTFTESQLLHPAALNPSSFTFMAFEATRSANLPTNNVIIVDIVLSQGQELGTITATKSTIVLGGGSMDYNIMHTSCSGITRAITYSGITRFEVYGFTIVNYSDGTSVERRALPIRNHLGHVMAGAFDGYRGRICLLLESPTRIEIQDYV